MFRKIALALALTLFSQGVYAQSNPGTKVQANVAASIGGTLNLLTALSVGSQKALTAAIVDASGNQITTFGAATPLGALAGGASGTQSYLAGGVYNSAGVTLTNGQQAALQFDASGNLKTSGTFSGSISAGCTASATDPSYSAGAQNLSCDLSGYLRSLVKGTVAVSTLPPLVAGSAIVGKVGIDQTTPGTTNGVQINAALPTGANTIGSIGNTAFALNAGSNIVGKVGIDQTTPGTTNGVQVNAALPTGANTIGNVGVVAGSAIMGKVGIDQTTPGTTNGVQVNAALPTGTNSIGQVTANQSGSTSTMATLAPTAGTFSSALAANVSRKACTIQNTGTTLGYIYFGAVASATTSNSFQVAAGGFAYCTNNNVTATDTVAATCASGTCAFVISSQ